MQIKSFLSVLFAVLLPAFLYAQEDRVTVRGTITSDDGETIVGASVLIKGTNIGVSSDIEGKYELTNVPVGSTLEVSYVSYVTQDVPVNSRTVIDVTLVEDIQALGEVVVIGYGSVRKEDATGSVVAIKAESMNKGITTTPQELLSGRVAGVHIVTDGGAPGTGAAIRIRGGSSLNASNDPLIVVDGVPLNEGGTRGVANPLSMINSEDIETFTILKDASATAIYGARASNGVILITTKKPLATAKIMLTYSGNASVSLHKELIDVLSADEFRGLIADRFETDSDAYRGLGNADMNWQEEIYRPAFGTEHNISASGGFMDVIPYRLSLGYSNQQGILKTSDYERYSGSLNVSPSLFNDHLKLNVNTKLSYQKSSFPDWDAIGAAIGFDPTRPIYDPGSKFGGYSTWVNSSGNPEMQATYNPMAILNMKERKANTFNFVGSVTLDYKMHFLPDLRAVLNLAYDYSKGMENEYIDPMSPMSYLDGGVTSYWREDKKNELLEFYLNYNKDLNFLKSNLNVMAGYSWQHFRSESNAFSFSVLQDRLFTDNPFATEHYLISFYGRLNYSILNKYLLTFTLRDDASSRFAPDNRWGLFPSAAFAWKIAEESFMKNIKAINELKLRLGWGVTGQQNIMGDNNYVYMPRYLYSEPGAYYQFGDTYYRLSRPSAYNRYLKWEETTTYNIGLDFGLFNNRISGAIDVYRRISEDLISFVTIPAGTNFSNGLLTNFGTMELDGIEFTLNAKPFSKGDFLWDVSFNVAYNKREITKLSMANDKNYTVQTQGISGGTGNFIQAHRINYSPNSFFVYEQIYDTDGKPVEGVYRDRNGDGVVNNEDRYLSHNPSPDYTFGFQNKFIYKNWDLGFTARASVGNYMYNNMASNGATMDNRSLYGVSGSLNNKQRNALYTNFGLPQYLSDYYVQNASFLKVDNITLGYSFKKLFRSSLDGRIYGTVQNPVMITKYEGIDPERSNGVDNVVYPRPLIMIIGLSLNLK